MFYSILQSYLHLRLNWNIASQVGHKLSAVVCRFGICKLSEIYPIGAFYPNSYPNMRYRVYFNINHMVVFIPKANINHMVVYDGLS